MLRKHLLSLVLCLFLLLGAALPAYAAEGRDPSLDGDSGAFYALDVPEPGAPDLALVVEEPEDLPIFQRGAFEGPQTIPGEPAVISEYGWEDELYDRLTDAWSRRLDKINISDLNISYDDKPAFSNLNFRVINDHPEFFYASFYTYSYNSNTKLFTSITLEYNKNFEDLDQAVRDFNDAANLALAQIAGVEDDVEKALLLHDYLVLQCRYNWVVATTQRDSDGMFNDPYCDAGHPWTAYGALVGKDAVCQGYALAYNYLLRQAGIPSIYVSSSEMNHGWSGVLLGGNWYHVDATWDDPVPNAEGRCLHSFFLLSDAAISDSEHDHHSWTAFGPCVDTTYENGWAFNGVNTPFYRWNGAYYYTNQLNNDWKNHVFHTERLDGTGIEETGEAALTALGQYANYSAAWHNGRLYLIPYASDSSGTRVLLSYDLASGEAAQLGDSFPYTPSPSGDNAYSASYDSRPGLRYNGETNMLEAISPARREVVAQFSLPVLPTSAVTVEGSYADFSGEGEYAQGALVTLHAGTRKGYAFTGWTVSGAVLTNPGAPDAVFLMPDGPVAAAANWERIYSGVCGAEGDNLTWVLDSAGVLTISGTGPMADYYEDGGPWAPDVTGLVIEEGVSSIGAYAFCGQAGLTGVSFPESLAAVSAGAFDRCPGLETVHYAGSPRTWANIRFAAWSEALQNAEIIFGRPFYSVSVSGSQAAESGAGEYEEGETVTLRAGERKGYLFKGWSVSGAIPEDPDSPETTFSMPAGAVSAEALWMEKTPVVQITEHTGTKNMTLVQVSPASLAALAKTPAVFAIHMKDTRQEKTVQGTIRDAAAGEIIFHAPLKTNDRLFFLDPNTCAPLAEPAALP